MMGCLLMLLYHRGVAVGKRESEYLLSRLNAIDCPNILRVSAKRDKL